MNTTCWIELPIPLELLYGDREWDIDAPAEVREWLYSKMSESDLVSMQMAADEAYDREYQDGQAIAAEYRR